MVSGVLNGDADGVKICDVKKCVRIIHFGASVGDIIHQLHELT